MVLLDCLDVELRVEVTSEEARGECDWCGIVGDGLVPLSRSGSLDSWLGLRLLLVSNLKSKK